MESIIGLIKTLAVSAVALTVLFMVFLVVISFLPKNNPLRRVLQALELRVGATLAATAIAMPTEAIPGIDGLYDIGAPMLLVWYWYTFFKKTAQIIQDDRDTE